ncbi:hypothetical protein NDU88_002621 [Pleurodeles waltl]|uniref:Uncharacterized protein n=1 Tax=Pleurodeles waltl TaxID=8319 RepID=A0AAV7LG70_PLEWA|nr:hypothetical protein NDU88_002621 [Pleurodeles waltl]
MRRRALGAAGTLRQGADEVRGATGVAEGVAVPGGHVAFGERLPDTGSGGAAEVPEKNCGATVPQARSRHTGSVVQCGVVRCCALQTLSGCTSWNTEEQKELQPQRDCETETSPPDSHQRMAHRGTWGT